MMQYLLQSFYQDIAKGRLVKSRNNSAQTKQKKNPDMVLVHDI